MLFQSSNPTFNSEAFTRAEFGTEVMTMDGTVNKSFLLGGIVLIAAAGVWLMGTHGLMLGMTVGSIGALIVYFAIMFKPQWVPVLAPVYAALQGMAIGGISAFLDAKAPGIALQAVGLTFGILFTMLGAYKSGMIKATEKFKAGMTMAIGGIFIVAIVQLVLGLFGVVTPFYSAGPMGILFSLFVVVIASLALIMDFSYIEEGIQSGAPKQMEWYGAFGLMVTLIWLYIEILQLLFKISQSRD